MNNEIISPKSPSPKSPSPKSPSPKYLSPKTQDYNCRNNCYAPRIKKKKIFGNLSNLKLEEYE